jgi:hypothetical protein
MLDNVEQVTEIDVKEVIFKGDASLFLELFILFFVP